MPDYSSRSRYLAYGWAVASHIVLWDVITYTCPRHQHLAPKSVYVSVCIYAAYFRFKRQTHTKLMLLHTMYTSTPICCRKHIISRSLSFINLRYMLINLRISGCKSKIHDSTSLFEFKTTRYTILSMRWHFTLFTNFFPTRCWLPMFVMLWFTTSTRYRYLPELWHKRLFHHFWLVFVTSHFHGCKQLISFYSVVCVRN